ncbi:HpcH/HpaI aldolase/citrate lyase family protein [Kineococcus rubinsiae]|uniref:HpcH/HpaI aldolase/citrate lyase family protein n=1 Tax=Kineococcus rubinsiae TaxID=2609562 RepID=UPI0014306BE4|nr:HpcH/HpaI aldolase/citrate lyase family protein [Kineococcus rubinsiae]NIZ92684.1 HpcH/HpaI aldolase/citrate lyase family protein [Kineococcus rubinsiae]
MRHFSTLSPEQLERLFCVPPRPVDLTAGRDQLAVALGATIYCPATRQRLAGDLLRLARRGSVSAVACLEDSVPDDRVAEAEEILVRELTGLARTPGWREDPPLMLFVRTRTPEQLLSVVERAGVGLDCLLGFVLPKFGGAGQPDPADWLAAVRRASDLAGRRLWAMPVLESRDVAHLDTRHEALFRIREVLDANRDLVLAVRTGATDLSAAYGLRRPRGSTVWDVRVVADVLGDVVNVLGRADGTGHPITAPVWEHFGTGERVFRSVLSPGPFAESGAEELREQLIDDDLDGLVREIVLDTVNGLQGKTVIHPSHVAVVHAMSVVTHEDWTDASDVVGQVSGGAMRSSYRNKMNEAGPHRAWAERVLARADAFGVACEGVTYVQVLKALDEATVAIKAAGG